MPASQTLYNRLGPDKLAVLLRHFYADVRQHRTIGPIFNEQIQNWPEHLLKIGQFWARVTGGPSTYAGQMPARHLALGLAPEHFEAWLALWDANCRTWLAPAEAQEMSALAREIAGRLKHTLRLVPPPQFL